MQTIELERATIRVVKVFDLKAGRKRGTLKDSDGTLWSPWAKDMATYVEGREYDVEFEINENGGVAYRNIERGRVLPASRSLSSAATEQPAHKPAPQQNGNYRSPSPADQKSMFRCACMTAFIRAGHIRPDRGEIASAIAEINAGYDIALDTDNPLGAG